MPDANTDVIIASGVATMPQINGDVSCKSIIIQTVATLRVKTGFKLNITGH